MGNNSKIAYAVALALGGVAAAQAQPTVTQCKTPNNVLYVAGSSAAQGGFANALITDAFGGAALSFSASNGNFKAYCGISTNASVAPTGNVVLVHYRAEGGSVVGALPIVSGKTIKFLDLTNSSVTSTTVTTTGSSGTVGTTDGWGGPLTEHTVEVGVTDVEPGQFVGANYPTSYSTAVFGTASSSALSGLTKTVLFDQVFGLFVNTSGFNGGGTGQAVSLGKSAVANILHGLYTDWSQVPNSTNPASPSVVSSTAAPIYVINREAGSGTRTGASIYFLDYNCSQTSSTIAEDSSYPDGYQTADVLTTAESVPGAITYASIDNAGKPNLTTVSLDGVAPSNFAPVSGQYDWWYEAQLIKGTINSTGVSIYNFLTTELSNINTAPHQSDILAVPTGLVLGNPGSNNHEPGPVIYTNPYTRNSNSCSYPKLD